MEIQDVTDFWNSLTLILYLLIFHISETWSLYFEFKFQDQESLVVLFLEEYSIQYKYTKSECIFAVLNI